MDRQLYMRTTWSLTLISLGGSLVYSTTDNLPGFSALRAFGLALLALGGIGLLPRYPARTHPGAPAGALPDVGTIRPQTSVL